MMRSRIRIRRWQNQHDVRRKVFYEPLEPRLLLAADLFAEIAEWGVLPDVALDGGGYTLQTTGPGGEGTGFAREEGYQLLGGNGAYGADLPRLLRERGDRRGAGDGEGSGGGGGYNIPPIVNFEGFEIINDLVLDVPAIEGVLANDYDPDGGPNPLEAILYESPTHGSLTLNVDGSFIYDPDDGYVGDDFFSYKAFDGADTSEVMSVYLVINGVEIQYLDGNDGTPNNSNVDNLPWKDITDTVEVVWVGERIIVRSQVTGIPVWNQLVGWNWTIDETAIAWWGANYSFNAGNPGRVPVITNAPPSGNSAEVYDIPTAMKSTRYATFYFTDDGIKDVELGTWTTTLGVLRTTQFDVHRPDPPLMLRHHHHT
ncbi:MAG: Ig-like domain-containing protein [bacterium]|nr:Ig-like domain-containing protein [bacterium]